MAKKKEQQNKQNNSSYTAKDIYVLEGLDPVRKRPGMYIGSTGVDGLHHLIWEVLDNSIDEAMAGYANEITVSLLPGNRVKCTDNGRGIPVEMHSQTGKSALETVMTTLHAGGKFGSEAYKISGGLHGVGVSVVCALSKYMRAEVCRDNGLYMQEYVKGVPKAKVKKVDVCKGTGTTIIFEPDEEIFKDKDAKFSLKRILTHVRHQTYLTPKVKMVVKDETVSPAFSYTFYFEGGLKSYLRYLLGDNEPKHENPFYCKAERDNIVVETVLQYAKEMECFEESFANNIGTGEGGTHLTGFRTALTRVINDYARKNGYLKEKDENLLGNDMREGLVAVVSIKIREPQFEGQTKAKLGNTEAKAAVEGVFGEAFSDYLEKNPTDARIIVENCLLSARARRAAKAARTTILRKGILDGLTLPGKLSDCRSKDASESELYIVEGDSAGGSSRQARDSRYQAILPLRGKILNVEKARIDKMLSNEEIRTLITAIGTGIGEDDFDISRLRYHKIVIMTDADVDGAHIRTLLMTFFYRQMKALIEEGHLYIAQPPLYRIAKGKEEYYVFSEDEKDAKVKHFGQSAKVTRYKGLGEMNPEQLWKTTMDPSQRIMLKVNIDSDIEAHKMFVKLMGEEVEPRREFIERHARDVKNLDI